MEPNEKFRKTKTLLRSKFFATLLLVLVYIPSCETCIDFWQRWERESCGLQELCLSETIGNVKRTWKQNVLDCHGVAPDKDLFRCGNISLKMTSLITKNCKYSNFDMKEFLYGRDPAVVYLDYTEGKTGIIPLQILFSKMASLEMVFVRGSRTGGLFQLKFDAPNKIQTLEINDHDFSSFPRKPFINLTKLTRMEITSGKIRRLSNHFFSRLTSLKDLSLSSNEISEVQTLAFKHLTSLAYLDLSRNRITVILNSTFDPLISLEEIDLSHNPLQKLPWSQPFGSSKHLSVITIAYGKLTEFPHLDWNAHDLISVDLMGNNIKEAVLPVFTRNRTNVKLSSNNIKTIKLNHTETSDVSPVYYLFYNEPICDCRLEPFLAFLQSGRQKSHMLFPGMDVVACAAPNSSRTLADVWPEHMSCSIKDCPPKCSCLRISQDAIEVNCSDRGLVQSPKALPLSTVAIYLQNNYIENLSNVEPSSWNAVTDLHLTNNKVKTLQHWAIPPNLTVLAADRNYLTNLPKPLTEAIDRSTDFQIYLAKNNWTCNCTSAAAIYWMQQNQEKVMDYGIVTCKTYDKGKWTKQLISGLNILSFCPSFDRTGVTSFPLSGNATVHETPFMDNVLICSLISILAVLLLSLLLCLLLHRRSLIAKLYRRKLRAQKDEDKTYDVIVCYSDSDRRIANCIVAKLEPQYRVLLHDRNALSAPESKKRLEHFMRECKAVLLIISDSLIRSKWFEVEFRKAYKNIPERCKRKIIPIFLGDVQYENKLPRGFRHFWNKKSNLRWDDNFFWEKLLYFLRD